MKFYWYPKCSTCVRAKKILDEHKADYQVLDIVKETPTAEELETIHKRSGLALKRLFNTSGMRYRELGLKDKLEKMSEQEQYQLLASDGMLIKRPLLVTSDTVIIGAKDEQYRKLLS